MSKANLFETDFLKLIFNATALADLAQNDASGPATNLYISLHTADPGEAGAQNTSEANYGAYARVAVARTTGGFAVSGNQVTNVADIIFPEAISGSNTITHAAVGVAASGAGYLLYSGSVPSPLVVTTGIEPQLSPGDLVITED